MDVTLSLLWGLRGTLRRGHPTVCFPPFRRCIRMATSPPTNDRVHSRALSSIHPKLQMYSNKYLGACWTLK